MFALQNWAILTTSGMTTGMTSTANSVETNPMHKHLIAQSVAEMNPDYKPFKPFLKELYEEFIPLSWRWL